MRLMMQWVLALTIVLSWTMRLEAQSNEDVAKVEFSGPKLNVVGRISPAKVEPGKSATLEFEVTVDPEWHIYSVKTFEGEYTTATAVTLSKGPLKLAGPLTEPEPHFHDGDEYSRYHYHEGTVTFGGKLEVEADAPAGEVTVAGTFEYQACDANGCLEPQKLKFRIPMTIVGPPAAGKSVDVSRIEAGMTRLLERLDAIESAVLPRAAEPPPERPTWSPEATVKSISRDGQRPGETATIEIELTTPAGVKLKRARDVFVDFESSTRIDTIEPVDFSTDEVAGGQRFLITLDARFKDAAPSGKESQRLTLTLPLTVDGHDFTYKIDDIDAWFELGSRSILKAVLTAAIAALLALLTPCVFPMVPVTVSFFTKQAEKQQKNPLVMPLVYILGIVSSFVSIGVTFTAVAGAAGAATLATNGWLQGAFGLLFVAFSFSLFGVFTLQPPAFLMQKAGSVQGRGGLLGTLGMGLLFSLTSFTCTAPLVGTLLVDAATTGEWFFPIVGMGVFSTVLALPFFFLALFPKLLSGLPRSGSWMNAVKVTLGFLELAFALKFIGGMDAYFGLGIFTRTSILWMWVFLFAMNGLYLLRLFKMGDDEENARPGPISASIGVILILFAALLMRGTDGETMPYLFESLLPPPLESTSATGQLGWANRLEDDLEGATELAKSLGKPLFIDFTGFT